jgi:hypothetical protein
VDLTACAGGSTAGFVGHFQCVTAVELDPDRAEDLLHNMRVVLGMHHTHASHTVPAAAAAAAAAAGDGAQAASQQQQRQQEAAATLGSTCRLAFDQDAVPHLAVLQCQQQHSQQQTVAVVCGDGVRLLAQLQQQDVVFVDPPWGGPQYCQQQQQQQQQQRGPCGQQQWGAGGGETGQLSPGASSGRDAATSSTRRTGAMCSAAAMSLGDTPLLEVCAEAAARCSVLGVRLPSRCHDLQAFAKALLQQAQQQPGGGSCGGVCAALVPLGRSCLLVVAQGSGTRCGRRRQQQQQQQQQQQVCAAVKACLQQHGTASCWVCA